MVPDGEQCRFAHLVWYQDDNLPQPVADLVSQHIAECEYCNVEAYSEMVVSRLLQRVQFEPAPASLRLRISTKITTIRFDN